jgi:hypothetical protein
MLTRLDSIRLTLTFDLAVWSRVESSQSSRFESAFHSRVGSLRPRPQTPIGTTQLIDRGKEVLYSTCIIVSHKIERDHKTSSV